MRIRIEYSKLKALRYISHLELMDTIRRAVRRADLPAKYTAGYNPHLILSLCQPLAVGMVGMGEYFDLELKEKISEEKIKQSLNFSLPAAIDIKEAKYVPEDVKSLQAIVNTAIYSIDFDIKEKSFVGEKLCQNFLNEEKIEIIRHRRNKDDRVLDLRPMIYDVKTAGKNGIWKFTVNTGSSGNVRPSELIRAFASRYDFIEEVPLVNVVREGMYVRRNNSLFKPFAKRVVRS